MGADFHMNPPDAHEELWEEVRNQGDALRRERQTNNLLRVTLADRNAEIAALKQALISLGQTGPINFKR